MITLYHRPRTRSDRFAFLLEELGAPYEIKVVTTKSGDGSGAKDPANPHPHGKVPAISDDGQVVFESSAIALYLTDRFPGNGIGAQVGDPKRGAYLTWLAYYSGVLEPAFISKFMNTPVPVGTAGWVPVEDAMAYVNEALTRGPYLLGDTFSAADVLYGTTFAMFGQSPMMPKHPAVEAYTKRVTDRPAHARGQAKAHAA